MQESGNRRARALPYQADAACRIDRDNRVLRIEMSNTGVQPVHHAIYDNSLAGSGPRQYDVPASGGSVEDQFSIPADGGYDLSVYGPNGFLRRAAGNITGAGSRLQVSSSYDFSAAGRAKFRLTIFNGGNGDLIVTIQAGAQHRDQPRIYALAPGQTSSDFWDVQLYTNGWYDFSVTADGDPEFLRRFAGHLETGSASLTGMT